jgi:hypothetical protein
MANDFPKTPYDAWQQRCHPNAPAGGGGPGCFTSADPFLRSSSSGWQSLPHPDSPAARYLTPQEIRAPDLAERVQAVVQAYTRALRLAPAAVYRETGCQLDQIIDGLLPGLLQMLAALGISAMAGASTGAAVGFFLGGVGAAPGAIVGGELGLEAGTALLAWMGLGFLAVAIGQGMGELTGVLRRAIHCAWQAPEHRSPPFEIDRAAEDLARAVGILFRLILQGLLAYVLKNGAVSAGQVAASTGRTIISGGTHAAADATLAEVSALLRKSKLPDGFVVWLERNWEDLKWNPKLVNDKTAPNNSSQSSSAVTPSELKVMRERLGRDDVAGKSSDGSNAIPERITNKKGATIDESKGKGYSRAPDKTNLKQTGGGSYAESADELYDAIRASDKDVSTIANNTGIKQANIQKVKEHVFYNEHLLDRYVEQGIPAEVGRFDSNMAQAQAWQRLENGTHTKADITWLKHETAERWYELKHKSGYTEAHDAVDWRWSGNPWSTE